MMKLLFAIIGSIVLSFGTAFCVIVYASYIFGFIGFLLLFLLKLWYITVPFSIIIYFLSKNGQKN